MPGYFHLHQDFGTKTHVRDDVPAPRAAFDVAKHAYVDALPHCDVLEDVPALGAVADVVHAQADHVNAHTAQEF